MHVEANTFGSSYDTTLSVSVGERGALTQLACNDDTSGLQSRVRLDIEAGHTYWIMVGAYASGAGGALTLNLQAAVPVIPPELTLALARTGSVTPRNGSATVSGTITCSTPAAVQIFGVVQQKPGHRNSIGYFSK